MRKYIIILSIFAFAITATAQIIQSVDSALMVLKTTDNYTLKIEALTVLYNYYYNVKRDSAMYYGNIAVELAKANNDTELLYDIYSFLGGESRTAGNYPAALEWNNKMLSLAQQNNDSIIAAQALNAIGNLYKDQKLYTKAIIKYNDCKKLSERSTDTGAIINNLFANMNLGYVYEQMKLVDSALYFAQTAYALALKLNDKESLAFVLNTMGNIQAMLNNKSLALEYYKMAIASAPEKSRYLCMIYMELAKFFTPVNKDSAINYARKSLVLANTISHLKFKAESAKMLSELHLSAPGKDSAFYYQNMYVTFHDSLNNRERIAQFENLNFNEALHLLEEKEALERAEEKRTYNIQLVIITLVILSLLMLFLLISRTIIVSHNLVAFLSIVLLLVLFEFINLLLHPILENITNDKPVPMLLVMVAIAALLVPLHRRMEKWTTNKLVEKNKSIRLANAKKVIEELEKKTTDI